MVLGIVADEIIPMYGDMCASFLYHMRKHVCQRVQRALEYIDRNQIIPGDKKTLVRLNAIAVKFHILHWGVAVWKFWLSELSVIQTLFWEQISTFL